MVIERIRGYVAPFFADLADGHDSGHLIRVVSLARHICQREGGDSFVAALIGWFHEFEDDKIPVSNLIRSPEEALRHIGVLDAISSDVLDNIRDSISKISYRGSGASVPDSLEGKAVQDSDRCDSLGFVGVARLFAYSGARGHIVYDPEQGVVAIRNFEEYRNKKRDAFNHFNEKILHLKNLMNTGTARRIAERRHQATVTFMEGFLRETNGKDFED
jgi:uncharacterized protein